MRGALGLALAALVASGAASAEDDAERRPNLLLIVAEDLSPRLGAYGDPVAQTPNLDRLAAEGVRYNRAFTTAGVCAPSRAAIVMGVHQNRFGAGHMRSAAGGYVAVPPPDWKAFPELLRAADYYTVNSGKTDYQMSTRFGGAFGGPSTIWDRDGGVGEGFFSDTWNVWQGRAPGQPFFAYLTLAGTHESQVWPTWHVASSAATWLLLPLRLRNHARWEHRTDPAALTVPPYYPDTPVVRADLARHYDNIAAMDRLVGETLAALERDGLAEDTVVIFTTDHGDGLPRAKRWLYDSGLHVPLLVRWPGHLAPGTSSDELVSGVDFAPTLLALAGVAVPDHMEGRVLLGAERSDAPEVVFAARDQIDESPDTVRAARDRRFKYIRNLRPNLPYQQPGAFAQQMPTWQELARLHAAGALSPEAALWFREERPPEELYDTAVDPHELRDLSGDPAHAAELARLRAALDAWLEAAPDLGLLAESELRERFWPGGEQPVTPPPELVAQDGRAVVRSATPGASLGVRVGEGEWQLYTGAAPVGPGVEVEARAVRYGWVESETVTVGAQ
ncbi:MAG: sulfatase [Myxococcota bacterium]